MRFPLLRLDIAFCRILIAGLAMPGHEMIDELEVYSFSRQSTLQVAVVYRNDENVLFYKYASHNLLLLLQDHGGNSANARRSLV